MAELKDMLQGVAEAKQRRFADEDFAGAHARVVTGRVKRRRAATTVGVGGASVLGASALAVGVINVPWGALGTAGPGSVTTTPQASESVSAPPSPSASPEPSVSATVGPLVGETPFQCGYVLPVAEFGSDSLRIEATHWTGAELTEWIEANDDPSDPDVMPSEAVVPMAISTGQDEPLNGVWDGSGSAGFEDPAREAAAGEPNPEAGVGIISAVTFVAVKDGTVVGHLRDPDVGESPLTWLGLNNGVAQGMTVALLRTDPAGAMTSCSDAELAEDWTLYAVAGTTFLYPDGSWDPVDYAWAKFE